MTELSMQPPSDCYFLFPISYFLLSYPLIAAYYILFPYEQQTS